MTQIKILPIKTVAGDNDLLVLQDPSSGQTYSIKKSDLFAGLSNGGGVNQSDSHFGSVVLLAHLDSLAEQTNKILVATGNAQFSDTNKKFGTKSLLLDGASSLFTNNSSDFNFTSASNFTIEAWVYRTSSGVTGSICGKLPQIASQGYSFHIKSNDNLAFESDGAAPNIDSGINVPINQWVYVAVSKSGNDYTFAVNSTTATVSNASSWGASDRPLSIGQNGRGDQYAAYFVGYIDELRISNIARNISILPTSQFPDNGGINGIALTYASNGDNNGLFYFLGTAKNTTTWGNPFPSKLNITASSVGVGDISMLSDRVDNEFYTNNDSNGYVSFQILLGTLKCNYYSIRNRFRADGDAQHNLRNWKLQGSNDGASWIDLDTQINNASLIATSQWLSLPVSPSNTAYSYFRILQTGANSNGANYLCLSEIELYGIYN